MAFGDKIAGRMRLSRLNAPARESFLVGEADHWTRHEPHSHL